MQIYSEKYRYIQRNAEKCREMQRNVEKCREINLWVVSSGFLVLY